MGFLLKSESIPLQVEPVRLDKEHPSLNCLNGKVTLQSIGITLLSMKLRLTRDFKIDSFNGQFKEIHVINGIFSL